MRGLRLGLGALRSTLMGTTGSGVPALALLDRAGALILDRFGANILTSGAVSFAPLIIFTGESNSGGNVLIAAASTAEKLPRTNVKILNNTSLVLETLLLGTNNLIGHTGFTDNTVFSWETQLANQVDAGNWGGTPIYLVKTGQGGSTTSQWQAGGGYQTTFNTRLTQALALIKADRKTPLPIIWMSLGINDQLLPTAPATFKSQMVATIALLRSAVGMCPVILTHLTPARSSYDVNIDQVVADTIWSYVLDTTPANTHVQADNNHWDYTGQGINADGFKTISLDNTKIGLATNYQSSLALWDGSVARSGTVWDINAKGTSVLIRGQRQFAYTLAAGFTSVRGTTGKASGKWYFEVKMRAPQGNAVFVGLMDGTTAGGAGLEAYNPANSGMTRDDGFNAAVGFTAVGTGGLGTLASGDVIGCHYDVDAKKMWLSKNNVALSTGNPATGANPYFTWTAAMTVFPAIAMSNQPGALELIPSATTYTPATGFTVLG